MKSEWMVADQVVGHARFHAVYRLIDEIAPDNSENREYRGYYAEDREAAVLAAKALNDKESQEWILKKQLE